MRLSDDKPADIIDAFDTTSRYLDDILNINDFHFDNVASQMQNFNLIKQTPLIWKPLLCTCICSFLKILFLPKILINLTILILKMLFPFLDGDVLILHPMESISLN